MTLTIVPHSTVHCTRAPQRQPPLGLVLHNTVTFNLAAPRPGASWHFELDRAGVCHQYVYATPKGHDYAHHVRAADEWRPPWVVQRDPQERVSDVNSCTVGIELVSYMGATNPAPPTGYKPYTYEQYAALHELLALLTEWWGSLPIVTHGDLQVDRTDPVALDMTLAGLVWHGDGYRYEPAASKLSANDQAILDLMRALGAGVDSIHEWISQIGALNERVSQLEADLAACRESLPAA